MAHKKKTKLIIHSSSKIPKRYRHKAIFVELHRAVRISANFDAEVSYTVNKFRKADCPNIANGFLKSTNDLKDLHIIPLNLFETEKPFILTEIQFSERN